jgi:hypothetical protein
MDWTRVLRTHVGRKERKLRAEGKRKVRGNGGIEGFKY